jgi:hypothetical protein
MTGQNWRKCTVRLDGRSSFIEEQGMELKKVCDFPACVRRQDIPVVRLVYRPSECSSVFLVQRSTGAGSESGKLRSRLWIVERAVKLMMMRRSTICLISYVTVVVVVT